MDSTEKFNQIIDEVYNNYLNNFAQSEIIMSREEFLASLRAQNSSTQEIAANLSLVLEDQELSDADRMWLCSQKMHIRHDLYNAPWYHPDNPNRNDERMSDRLRNLCETKKIPTRLITLTYQGESTQIYE